MKKLAILGLLALLPFGAKAQNTNENKAKETPKHLNFMGVSISGSIDDFTSKMEPRYKLKKRVGADNYYIFEGPMFGHNVLLQTYYTRKSRTPYRVVVSPKIINTDQFKDSLIVKYGTPEQTEQGLLWQRPEGIILYYTPEGYDTAVIYLDNLGNAAYREEK